MTLSYIVPEKDIVAFAEGVMSTLFDLEYDFSYDETSPPNDKGDVTYRVFNVKKETEE